MFWTKYLKIQPLIRFKKIEKFLEIEKKIIEKLKKTEEIKNKCKNLKKFKKKLRK